MKKDDLGYYWTQAYSTFHEVLTVPVSEDGKWGILDLLEAATKVTGVGMLKSKPVKCSIDE